ncbi:MAG: phosphoribosylamine--glycine ligase [Ahrensia sp.]|nr:phosphoribosylamine--glycine ligase [Ahrensia sp.]
MNILLIGSGGREHALAWAMVRSPLCTQLHIAPGNGGTRDLGIHPDLDIDDHGAIVGYARQHDVGLVVIGPEAPLVAGLADDLRAAGIDVFGPSAEAAQLEGSKTFTKQLCDRMNIPTAAYASFSSHDAARDHLQNNPAPIVVKADGLAAGKGVTVAMSDEAALAALEAVFTGDAEATVVIEQFLSGEEASMFFLCDGTTALPFGSAQDHKRVGDGDTGPNTGGMGAYSPAPIVDEAMALRVQREIVEPTLQGMSEDGRPFRGVLFVGLMIDADGPKLIEFNVRFGDPECQVLMMRLESDLVSLLLACARGDLAGQSAEWSKDTALTVVLAAEGYPGSYEKGSLIKGLPDIHDETIQVFHAGTQRVEKQIQAVGGRVLNVTALGANATQAQQRAYAAVDRIDWPEGFCRRDIGWRAVEREKHDG